MSRTSRRILTALVFSLLLIPSIALAKPQTRAPHARVATATQPGLTDLLRTGLSQLMAKLSTISPTPTPTPPPSGGGAGVRIDPEGHQ